MPGGYETLPEDLEGHSLLTQGAGGGQEEGEGAAGASGMEARLEAVLRRVSELEEGSKAAEGRLNQAKAQLAHLETIAISPASPAPPALYTSPAPAATPGQSNPPPPFDPHRRPDAPPAVQPRDGRGQAPPPRPADGLPALVRLPESQRPGYVAPSDDLGVSNGQQRKVCYYVLVVVLLCLLIAKYVVMAS